MDGTGKAGRTRKNDVHVWMSDEEQELLQLLAHERGLAVSQLLRVLMREELRRLVSTGISTGLIAKSEMQGQKTVEVPKKRPQRAS